MGNEIMRSRKKLQRRIRLALTGMLVMGINSAALAEQLIVNGGASQTISGETNKYTSNAYPAAVVVKNGGSLTMTAKKGNQVAGESYGLLMSGSNSHVTITSETGNNEFAGDWGAVVVAGGTAEFKTGGDTIIKGTTSGVQNNANVTIQSANNIIRGEGTEETFPGPDGEPVTFITDGNGIETSDYTDINANFNWVTKRTGSTVVEGTGDNTVYGSKYGIYSHDMNAGTIVISYNGTNEITGGDTAVLAYEGGQTTIKGKSKIIGENGSLTAAHGLPYICYESWVAAKPGTFDDEDEDSFDGWDDDSGSRKSVSRVKIHRIIEVPDLEEWGGYIVKGTDKQVYSRIALAYGKDSEVSGDLTAYDGGTISIVPQDGGSLTISGNINTLSPYKEFKQWRIFRVGTLNSGTDEQDMGVGLASGPISQFPIAAEADIVLSNGSTLTGTTDTGLVYSENTANAAPLIEDENTVTTKDEIIDAADANSVLRGKINLELNDTSVWNMTGHSDVTLLGGSGGRVHFQNGGDALEIDRVTGTHSYDMDLNFTNPAASDMLYVIDGTSDTQTLNVKNMQALNASMQVGDAVRFATIKNAGGGFTEGRKYYASNGLYNDILTVDYRSRASDPDAADSYNGDGVNKPTDAMVEARYGGENAQNVYLVKQAREPSEGAVTPGKVREINWRYVNDLDTFTKRTGQSVYFDPEADQGGWVRLGYRNLGVDDVAEVDGNSYELGWTRVSHQNDENKRRFSASLAYTDPEGHWENYGGSLKVRDFSVNLYDSHKYYPAPESLVQKPAYKADSHAYWDNYLKYHHVLTEYDATDALTDRNYHGKYSQNVVNLSTEYGHKLVMDKKWFWVPQAQLQLSYLGGYDYVDSQGLHVDGDNAWSLIGRLGFDVVRNLDPKLDSKLYFKASLLHEFLDGNDITTRYEKERYVDNGDQSGTWGVVGIGYSAKIGAKQYMYIDAERYLGNDFKRTYDIRAGVNWKF
jgi:outer membrane autotransporter protein